jgi:hypothetical protein
MLLGGDADGPEASYFFEHSWDGENFVSISSIPPKQKIPWEHVRGIHRPFFNSSNEISIRKKKTAHVHHVHPIFPESFQKFPVRKTPKKNEKKKTKNVQFAKAANAWGPPAPCSP